MQAALEGRGASDHPKIFLVTVLTSLDQADFREMGSSATVQQIAQLRARRALDWGCDGVITSAHEARSIRELAGDRRFLITTPGIRPRGADINDHKRAATPTEAIESGADYLVVGRPIIRARDPAAAALRIIEEMQDAFDSLD